MKAGQVAPKGLRGIGYHSEASHVPPSHAANSESNIGVKGFHPLCMALL